MIVKKGEYQGHKMMIFKRDEDDRFPTQLGVKKLAVVLEYADKVCQFLLEEGGESGREAVEAFLKKYQPKQKNGNPPANGEAKPAAEKKKKASA